MIKIAKIWSQIFDICYSFFVYSKFSSRLKTKLKDKKQPIFTEFKLLRRCMSVENTCDNGAVSMQNTSWYNLNKVRNDIIFPY